MKMAPLLFDSLVSAPGMGEERSYCASCFFMIKHKGDTRRRGHTSMGLDSLTCHADTDIS